MAGAGPEGASAEAPWAHLAIPDHLLADTHSRGSCIDATELRAISLAQLTLLGELVQSVLEGTAVIDLHPQSSWFRDRILWHHANMYHVCDHFIKPLTARFGCSYVELVASGPQAPVYFVSHAWSTRVAQTLAMLSYHAEVHSLDRNTPYWICTTAKCAWHYATH